MKDFKDKVAVITGAASGIGRGLAERCVMEGMRVVLADVETAPLLEAERELKEKGGVVLAVKTDVSRIEEIERLAQISVNTFGGVHLLCNNAGVAVPGLIWEASPSDWKWLLGVNLWGVIHGIRTFVPIMLKQNTESHIVNTASIEGLLSHHRNGPYQVSKHGVVALSEVLQYELTFMETKIGVSVLCPGAVKTRIPESSRNRPQGLQPNPENIPQVTPKMQKRIEARRKMFESAMLPSEVADKVFKAIRDNKFYIITHPELKDRIQKRHVNIIEERTPTPEFTISTEPDL